MQKLNLSRRSFVKAMAVTAAVAASGAAGVAEVGAALAETGPSGPASEVKRIRTCCRGCGKMECGVWVTVENGRAVRIEGDESAFQSAGHCCTKSQASLQAAYHPDRVHYPMIRTNPKGDSDPGWKRVSWDEAFAAVIKGITTATDKYGTNTFVTMMGTSRMWASSTGRAFMSMFGGVNNMSALQICKGPRRLSGALTMQEGIYWMATVDRPRVYVQWGTDTSISNYDDSGRTTVEAIQHADTHILIDPRVANSGKTADYHIALRPGTDLALALGWTRIVMEKRLYDDNLCRYWSNAPFLVCEDVEPTGWVGVNWNTSESFEVKTRLLKESDLIEGGDPKKFMVWDEQTDSLKYFDANEEGPHAGMWEGQSEYHIPTTGVEYERGGWVPDKPEFPEVKPALWCDDGYEVTLKDGRVVKVKTVWQTYWDEDVSEWTLEKTAATCDVDAQLIEDACLAWAVRPADQPYGNGGLHAQLAPEQTGMAVRTFRAIHILFFMTDNYDTPAGNRGRTRQGIPSSTVPMYKPAAADTHGMGPAKWETRKDICGAKEYPITRWWDQWTDCSSVVRAMESGEPYPVKCAGSVAGDFMNQSNANWVYEQLKNLDFFMMNDLWLTPQASIADVFLPSHHWLETLGWWRPSQGSGGSVGLMQQCITPPGDVMFECDMYIQMLKAMGKPAYDPDKYPDPWGTYEWQLDADAKASGLASSWKEACEIFQEKGWWSAKAEWPEHWGTYRRFIVGTERNARSAARVSAPDGIPGTCMPTMKYEFWSTIAESCLGEDELPYFCEPVDSPVSRPDLFEDHPFIMTTGRRIPVYFHSEHRQLPWCRELWPAPRVEINPDDAEKLGIEQGDWVWIESPWGKIRETADLFYGVKPGVINAEHQWWFPELQDAKRGYDLCSVNCLMDKDAQDPISGASQLRALPVKIYKATPENSPFGNPVPCGPDGTEIIHDASDPRLKEWLPTYEGRD